MTVTTAAAAARRAVADVFAGRALKAFYIAVLAVALIGSTQGLKGWIHWITPAAFGATLLAELGGVALNAFADGRRQKGERALAARVLGAGFAVGAIAVQLRGHAHTDGAGLRLTSVGLFFAGFSAAGYIVFLLDSAAKRRDALRDAGKLAEPPPVYGAYQWCRHPLLTARARRLAVTNAETRLVERITSREQGGFEVATTPLLGRAGSLAAAAAQVAEERRLAAIRKALRGRITDGVDPTMATIAVHTYDLARVAQGIADGADYPALTKLIADELTPARIHAGVTARRARRTWFSRGDAVQTNEIVAALAPVSAPETDETAPETVETDPAPVVSAWPVTAPAGARLLPIVPAVAPAPEPEPTPATTPIVVPRLPLPMARRTSETVETAPETDRGQAPAPTDENPADQAPPLPPIAPALLPHLAKVMAAHRDWYLTITMSSRHPEALTYAKIKAAIGMTGQQLCADIRTALLSLCGTPEAAEEFVGVAETATAAA